MRLTPGVNLIKLFWHKFTYSNLKARVFHIMAEILLTFIKGSNLQKRLSKITPKSFMRSTPEINLLELFDTNLLTLF